MDDAEKKLYLLMEIAEQQQQAVKAALAALEARQTTLVKTSAQLQTVMQTMLPAAEAAARKGATEAVKAALENASKTATDAVAKSCQPLLAGLAGVTGQASAAEDKLKGAVEWFGWRWAALAASTACGAILALLLSAWGMVWWQRAQLAEVKAERAKLGDEVAAAKSTLAALEKRTGGVRYAEGSDGRFILVRKGFETLNCVGDVPCIRLK
jgi:hypothetical protein